MLLAIEKIRAGDGRGGDPHGVYDMGEENDRQDPPRFLSLIASEFYINRNFFPISYHG